MGCQLDRCGSVRGRRDAKAAMPERAIPRTGRDAGPSGTSRRSTGRVSETPDPRRARDPPFQSRARARHYLVVIACGVDFIHRSTSYPQAPRTRWMFPVPLATLMSAGNKSGMGIRESEKAMNETSITIVGNVISDVRSRRTADGHRVVSFRVASNERRFDKEAGEWVDGDRLFVTVTCWRKLANGVAMSLSKGDPVMVTGRLYTRGYEVEGQKRSATELLATAVGPDLSRCAAELLRVRRSGTEEVIEAVASEDAPAAPRELGGEAEAAERDGNDHEAERERRLEVVAGA